MALSDLPPPKQKSSLGDLPPPSKTDSSSESYYTPSEPFSIPSATEGALPDVPSIASSAYQTFKEYQPQLKKGMLLSPMGVVGPAGALARPKGYVQDYLGAEAQLKEIEKKKQQLPAAERTVGELLSPLPGIPGMTAIEKLGTKAATLKSPEILSQLLGKETKGLRSGLSAQLQKLLPSVEKEAVEKGTRRELNLRKAGETFETKAQKANEDSALKFSGLGKPMEQGKFGDMMQDLLVRTEARLSSNVSRQAEQDFDAYFKQAKNFDKSLPRQEMIKQLEIMLKSSEAGSVGRDVASKALKDLKLSKDAMGAEKEFRKYFQEASAPQQYGFGAEQQQAYRNVSDIISNALNKHAPLRVEARQTYKEFNTPLDAYETLFGKKAVAVEKDVPTQLKMMPTDIPNYYFKNRDTINNLRNQLRGDETAVRKFANQHLVNELQGKTALEAATWYNNNKSWIDTVQGLNSRAEAYVKKLGENEAAAQRELSKLPAVEKKSEEVVKTRQESEKFIRDGLRDINEKLTSDPKKFAGEVDKYIDGLTERKLINNEQRQNLKQQIINIRTSEGDTASARKKALYLISAVGAGGTVVGGVKVFGGQ